MPAFPSPLVLLHPDASGASVTIHPRLGAWISSWLAAAPGSPPIERLHRNPWASLPSPPDLRGGIPLLFPVCGRTRAADSSPSAWTHLGVTRPMPMHGFAWRLPWTVLDHTPSSVLLALDSSPTTAPFYPFPFRLRYRVSLLPTSALQLSLTLENPSPDAPLPHLLGFHPYLRLDPDELPSATVTLPAATRALHYDSTYTRITSATLPPPQPMPLDRPLPKALLLQAPPGSPLTLHAPCHALQIRETSPAPVFAHWQFYADLSPSFPAPFLCPEPWLAPAGALSDPAYAPPPLPPRQTLSATLLFAPA